jgi:hypothetical protein
MITKQLDLSNPTEKSLSISVPSFPSSVRYIDDYTDKEYNFADFGSDCWKLFASGSTTLIKFNKYSPDPHLQLLIKIFAADLIGRFSPRTARLYVDGLAQITISDIVSIIESTPECARPKWDALVAKNSESNRLNGLKSLLKFCAERHLGAWTPLYLPFISTALPCPSRDKFASVRNNDVFISVEEESCLVRWIYERSIAVKSLSSQELSDTGIIICSYQFAMRPKQIGLLRKRDCRVIVLAEGGSSVHLTFRMIKQRSAAAARTPLIRKVKREWASIFTEISIRAADEPGEAYLFGHISANSVSRRILELLSAIMNSNRSATDMRHSGAMRLVDAGASAEEVAEFMGHSSTETALVYYDASPTQAQRVNNALGISETYQRVATIAKDRYISAEELAQLKGEQQIAGAPHGIAIAGIGGCKTGQPLCPFNPIMACYGCPKFLPLRDLSIHRQVLSDFREVVKFFHVSSREESESPAYLQLKRTISDVNLVIDTLEDKSA